MTELADTLVRDHSVPFTQAHAIAGKLVEESGRRPQESQAMVLADVSRQTIGRGIEYDDA